MTRRVVIDARSVAPKKSGIGNYTDALIRHLVPMAPDLEFMLLRHPDMTAPITRADNVTERVFAGETKSTATVFRIGLSERFGAFDLYHSPADLIPLGLSCPWVVTCHDLMWIEAPGLASGFLPERIVNGLWYRANFARGLGGARRVIAISHATKRALERHYPQLAGRVRVVHHGLDHERYASDRALPRDGIHHLVPENTPYSLIVGQGSPYKNHARMIQAFVRAFRDQPGHKLVMVRRFTRVDRTMRRLLARPEVKDRLIALPSVSDSELIALYKHARQLLFVSLYEGFGLPPLEAMSLGTPVLASTAEAVKEVTGDAALHAVPTDLPDIVAKLQRIDSDGALRERLISAGRAHAASFSWDRCAEKTLAVYREALADRG